MPLTCKFEFPSWVHFAREPCGDGDIDRVRKRLPLQEHSRGALVGFQTSILDDSREFEIGVGICQCPNRECTSDTATEFSYAFGLDPNDFPALSAEGFVACFANFVFLYITTVRFVGL